MNEWLKRHPEWAKEMDLIVLPPTSSEVLEEFPDAAGSSLLQDHKAVATDGSTRLALYLRMRREGKDHRWADLLASQRPPGGVTDDTFFAGIPRLAEQIGSDKMVDRYVKAARKHGYNPSPNDVYQSGLARFPGDPEAFVSRTKGRGYIKQLCERRGWACEGSVNVAAREPLTDPHAEAIPLADNIVNRLSREMIQKNPDLKRKSRSELRKMVLAKHGPT